MKKKVLLILSATVIFFASLLVLIKMLTYCSDQLSLTYSGKYLTWGYIISEAIFILLGIFIFFIFGARTPLKKGGMIGLSVGTVLLFAVCFLYILAFIPFNGESRGAVFDVIFGVIFNSIYKFKNYTFIIPSVFFGLFLSKLVFSPKVFKTKGEAVETCSDTEKN